MPTRFPPTLLLLFLLLGGLASAEPRPCAVCSVEQQRLHGEECPLSTTYQDENYYFCKSGCRDVFLQDPERWSEGLAALRQPEETPLEPEESGSLVPS